MSSATVLPANTSYAKSFWSTDDSSQEILMKQNEKATKTLTSLSTFYKEVILLENEYSRKLSSLINRVELPKYETIGTLKTSFDVFQEQCLKISEAHSLQSRRIYDSLQIPLSELISERKAREKALEAKIHKSWSDLLDLKAKCNSKSNKYEQICAEMNALKSSRMTLDNRELEKLEEKLSALKAKMLIIREENWELITKYNERLRNWLTLWWDSCNDWQSAEEKRIRFLKSNMWEFANICSMFSVEQDQYSENMRTSLQDCSTRKDIDQFVEDFKTGDDILAPLKFIDFAKNETRPIHEETTIKFNMSEIPSICDKLKNNFETLQKKKNPPPPASESVDAAFSYIGKSKETFKQLQEEAQKEVSEMKLNCTSNDDAKSVSEPSTFKVMSDYSNPTTRTSISSRSFNEYVNVNNNISSLKYTDTVQQQDSSFSDKSDDESKNLNTHKSKHSINESIDNKLEFKNNDIFRDSMSPVKEKKSNKEFRDNSFATLVKNQFNESPNSKKVLDSSPKAEKIEFKQLFPSSPESSNGKKQPTRNSLMIAKSTRKNSGSIFSKRRPSSLQKSKSQYNLKDRHISLNELPTHSSEGYPIISYCKAGYNYQASLEEELSFKKKDILLILHKQQDGWWFAENLNSGDSGLVPCNYVKEF
jgi:hypothetical protein